MKSLEVLRVVNLYFGITLILLSFVGAYYYAFYNSSIVYFYGSIMFIMLGIALINLRPSIMQIHKQYFPAKKTVSKDAWNDDHEIKKCMPARGSDVAPKVIHIPAAKLVTED